MNFELSDTEIAFAIEVYMKLKGHSHSSISFHFKNDRLGATVRNIGVTRKNTEEILQLVKERKIG